MALTVASGVQRSFFIGPAKLKLKLPTSVRIKDSQGFPTEKRTKCASQVDIFGNEVTFTDIKLQLRLFC